MMINHPHIIYLATEADTLAFSARLAKVVQPGTIIYLHGDLGAGKTTLTRGFLRALGYQDKVKSPTYTLVEPYLIANHTIFHFDLYRIVNAQELDLIGIEEYFTPTAICIIEWPEKGFPRLPNADLTCHITFQDQGRNIQLEAHSLRGESILIQLTAS